MIYLCVYLSTERKPKITCYMAKGMLHLLLAMKGMLFVSQGSKCFFFSFTSYAVESCCPKIFI